jgi:lysine biosynthesis protein LysW
MTECPTCGVDFTMEAGSEVGEIIACADCGTELEVTGTNTVKEAPEAEEDWGE